MARTKDPLSARDAQAELSWDQALAWRLQQQWLPDPATDPAALAGDLAGVQVQVMSAAAHVIGIRSRAASEDVQELLWSDRKLVKTWAMRGTLHLLPSSDFPTWIASLRTREWRITAGWERYHGVTRAELDAITAAIPEALSQAPLTRDQLADQIARTTGHAHLGKAMRSGWAAVLKPAANRGLLCQGPPVNGNVTFVDPARWLGSQSSEPDTDRALATVLEWFLDAHGPATHDDFGRWFGITPRAARDIVARNAGELAVVDVAGRKAWMTPDGAKAAAAVNPGRSVYLLPTFDPYVLAPISHRDQTIPAGRVGDVSRTAGWISPVLLVNGRVAGTWTHERDREPTEITITPFVDLPRQVIDGVHEHLKCRHAAFLGTRARVMIQR